MQLVCVYYKNENTFFEKQWPSVAEDLNAGKGRLGPWLLFVLSMR